MTDFERERQLFDLCVDEEPQRWSAILDDHGAEPELRERVLRLLRHHSDTAARESGFLRLDPADPERIGPYRILQRLGEGGMGIVYAAEQREPVRRRVAIKVLRAGHHSREVLARFDAERQALSLMNHLGIARILDAGTTADQRPYIVMEYVSGEPITRYCSQRKPSLEAILELFRQVCDAVQHAHQKGVIHRDLKPSNILITEELGKPAPKIIDFGIAKALTVRLTEHTLETRVGSFLGTPDYMSPEQADVSPLDVDTRADVYALGAILYELLTGTTPLQISSERHSWTEIQKIIREQEPPPPGRRTPHKLPRELDWITCKALEKERNRRYATAAAFSEDITAVIEGRAPQAGPHTFLYRTGKLLRQHALAAATATTVFMLVLIFGAVMAWQASQIARERDRASTEAAVAKSVTQFTARLFELADPQETGQPDITARGLLALGLDWLESNGDKERPEVRAALYSAASKAFHGLSDHAQAMHLAEEALELYRTLANPDVNGLGDALLELAHSNRELGQLQAAEQYAREALELAQRARHEELEHRALIELADVLRSDSDFLQSARILETLLERSGARMQTRDRSDALSLLARVYMELSRFAEAEKMLLEVISLETLDEGRLTARGEIALSGLARAYYYENRIDDAIRIRRELVQAAQRRYGEMHFETASAWNNLAFTLLDLPERHDEAEAALLRALEIRREVSQPDDPNIQTILSNLAWLYGARGDWEEALRMYNEVLRVRQTTLGEAHVQTANARLGIGRSLLELEHADEAVANLEQALEVFQNSLGEEHWRVGVVRSVLGRAMLLQGRDPEARAELRKGYELLLAELGPDHVETQKARKALDEAL